MGEIVLGRCRQLFLTYPQIAEAIASTAWTELAAPLPIPSTLSMELGALKVQTVSSSNSDADSVSRPASTA